MSRRSVLGSYFWCLSQLVPTQHEVPYRLNSRPCHTRPFRFDSEDAHFLSIFLFPSSNRGSARSLLLFASPSDHCHSSSSHSLGACFGFALVLALALLRRSLTYRYSLLLLILHLLILPSRAYTCLIFFFRLNLLRYSLHPDTLGGPSQSNALYLFFLLVSPSFFRFPLSRRTSSFPDLCLRPNKVQPSIFGHAAGPKQWSPRKRHVGATD